MDPNEIYVKKRNGEMVPLKLEDIEDNFFVFEWCFPKKKEIFNMMVNKWLYEDKREPPPSFLAKKTADLLPTCQMRRNNKNVVKVPTRNTPMITCQ